MKKFMWLLVDILNLLSLASVCITLSLMSGCMIVCLPAALCLLRFVTCILSFIDVQLMILFVRCTVKDPIKWNPATPRAILRKAHIREMRSKKHARRLLARCLKQIHKSHGPCVAWFFKPAVYPSFCKALVMLRILSWSCYLVTSCSTTCVLFEYNRIYASIFYACCVLVLPLLPTGSDIFRGSLALAAARCHTKSVDAHFDTQSARGHGTSAATGHGTSTATGHRISAATGHRMWGGGKRLFSKQSMQSPILKDRAVAQIWFPDDFEKEVVIMISSEPDKIQQGALQRCFDALKAESKLSKAINARAEMCMKGDDLVPRRWQQFEITFQNGLDPSRLTYILDRLYAELNIVDDSVLTENRAVLASLPPYCDGCDSFGHKQEECVHFAGRAGRHRTEQGFLPHASHAHGTYRLEKLGLNQEFERVIRINNTQWVIKKATGDQNNCLIDTMRQSIQTPDSIPDYPGYLDLVRRDLAKQFPRGKYRVRTADDAGGSNFLEFLEHVHNPTVAPKK